MKRANLFGGEFLPMPNIMKFTSQMYASTPNPSVKAKGMSVVPAEVSNTEQILETQNNVVHSETLPTVKEKSPQYTVKKNIFGKLVAKEVKK